MPVRQAYPEKQLEKKETDNLITGWEERMGSRKAEDDVGSSRKISYTAAVDFALQGFFCEGDDRLSTTGRTPKRTLKDERESWVENQQRQFKTIQ